MGKNLILEVANLLGVETGEKFMIRQNKYIFEDSIFMIDKDNGLLKILDDGNFEEENAALYHVLSGEVEIVKLPWEPEYKEYYYWPSVKQKMVMRSAWWGATDGYCLKALGMIYSTEEDAKEHLAEDYQRLTGKRLEEQANVKLLWEPKRGESYYAMSIVGCAQPKIACYDWNGSAADYECLKEGLIHKTQAEAEAHMAEHYERLTGKPLSSLE